MTEGRNLPLARYVLEWITAEQEGDMCEWTEPCYEPPLAEILADPIVRALMRRDRVEHGDIVELLARLATAHPESSLAAA